MEMMQIGQKVSGSYFGAAFAGEITDRRPHGVARDPSGTGEHGSTTGNR